MRGFFATLRMTRLLDCVAENSSYATAIDNSR